ncbi:MAG: hypothetical protein ACKV0T_20775 [Planctomycetales bacterium]
MSKGALVPRMADDLSEEQLISTAVEAVSQCRWVVGECAAKWTQRHARGRTDAEFGALIGVSGDQVYQRRRVWETFGAERGSYPALKWSHFYAALTWDDARDCLRWAEEMQSTVAEMRAWRRAQHGEDLLVDAPPEEAVQFLPTDPEAVLEPGEFIPQGGGGEPRGSLVGAGAGPGAERAAQTGFARQAGEEEYTPFRADAASPAAKGGPSARNGAANPPPSPEQLVRRMTSSFEKCTKILQTDFRKQLRQVPEEVRTQFLEAAAELTTQLAKLQ